MIISDTRGCHFIQTFNFYPANCISKRGDSQRNNDQDLLQLGGKAVTLIKHCKRKLLWRFYATKFNDA